MSQVNIDHVYKRFGKVTAVGDFNLQVKDGEFVSLLGPSGCGKTTTLRMVAGFERATEGSISIGDSVVSDIKKGIFMPPEKRDIGMVFQSYAVWPHMTVFQNVEYPLKIQKIDKETRIKRVREMLDLVHLGEYETRYPNQLSGGQQQRVSLARALVANPSLLLLDEPLSNLDAKLRESMRFEISALQKRLGITVIYVTHDQSEAMTMSDRIVVMSMGLVQQIGKPYDIYTHPSNKMVADFVGLVNFLPGEVKGDRVFLKNTEHSFANPENLTGEILIAVRPENIKMSKTAGMIKGVLKNRFYLGNAVDYRVQVQDHVIRVIIQGIQYGTYTDGQDVYLDFEKVMLFKKD